MASKQIFTTKSRFLTKLRLTKSVYFTILVPYVFLGIGGGMSGGNSLPATFVASVFLKSLFS